MLLILAESSALNGEKTEKSSHTDIIVVGTVEIESSKVLEKPNPAGLHS